MGLMLGGAFIQEYFNYVGGTLYRRDSVRLKWLLHTVILLATVSLAARARLMPGALSLTRDTARLRRFKRASSSGRPIIMLRTIPYLLTGLRRDFPLTLCSISAGGNSATRSRSTVPRLSTPSY